MTWPCTLLTCEVIWWPFVTLPRRTMTFRTATKYLCHKLPRICSVCRNYYPVLSSFITYHRICNKSNTTGASCGKWTTCLYRAPGLTSWGFVLQSTWADLLGVRVTEHLGWPLDLLGVRVARSFVVFRFVIVLSIFVWFTASDYSNDIVMLSVNRRGFSFIRSYIISIKMERTKISHCQNRLKM
jgi:hypothetical protein